MSIVGFRRKKGGKAYPIHKRNFASAHRTHPDLVRTVRIDTEADARRSVEELDREWKHASRARRLEILRAEVDAANIAEAERQRRNLSERENHQMLEVERIYRRSAARHSEEYRREYD